MGNLLYAESSHLTSIAQAIRSAKGVPNTNKYTYPLDFILAINSFVPKDAMVLHYEHTLHVFTNNSLTSVGPFAFYNYGYALDSVSLLNVSYIGSSAFYGASLVSLVIPNCTYIDYEAFCRCFRLQGELNLLKCSFIGHGAFSDVGPITLYAPELLSVEFSAFAYGNVKAISCPKLKHVGPWSFVFCDMSSIYLPACEDIGSNAFADNSYLTIVSLPKCSVIGLWAFEYCSNLASVYLLSNSRVSMGLTAFNSSCIFYVPNNLLNDYRTYFSSAASRFVGV